MVAVRLKAGRDAVLHRVVRVERDGRFYTRGDNTSGLEGPWDSTHFQGTMVAFESKGGRWMQETARLKKLMLRLDKLPRHMRQLLLRVWQPAGKLSAPWDGKSALAVPVHPSARADQQQSEEKVHWETQQMGSDIVALNRENGDIVILNQTASVVYSLVEKGLSHDSIVEAISTRYPDEKKARIGVDVEKSLHLLRSAGMIKEY